MLSLYQTASSLILSLISAVLLKSRWSGCLVIGLMIVAAIISSSPQGRADPIVYTSGPILNATSTYSGTQNTYPSIGELFTIDTPTTLTSAMVGLTVYQDPEFSSLPATPASLDWSIGVLTGLAPPNPYFSWLHTGSATIQSNSLVTTDGYWSAYNSTFALDVDLEPGTYGLSLYNAQSNDPAHTPWWDTIGGTVDCPDSVQLYQNGSSSGNFYRLSFTLYGVPEPSSLVLLVSAMMGLAVVYLRRRGMKS